ncbi:Hypothetical predicted protein [Octopus vulgaris]|uniref:Uncharacterized protein n=1 Tax=Octopus vulgaris TaxID=6645 RepID=A0AA36FG21_OCTVU|nr:Hypothetical predicted protein [Octopus vulgaris]
MKLQLSLLTSSLLRIVNPSARMLEIVWAETFECSMEYVVVFILALGAVSSNFTENMLPFSFLSGSIKCQSRGDRLVALLEHQIRCITVSVLALCILNSDFT